MKDILEPGDKVVRGPNWTWGSQDGTPNSIGTVSGLSRDSHPKWYRVKWPNGKENSYLYDLERDNGLDIIIHETYIPKVEKDNKVKPKKRTSKKTMLNALKDM